MYNPSQNIWFSCFSIGSVHHKWNGARLLLSKVEWVAWRVAKRLRILENGKYKFGNSLENWTNQLFPWTSYFTWFYKLVPTYFAMDCLRKFCQFLVSLRPFSLLNLIFRGREMWQMLYLIFFQEELFRTLYFVLYSI